MFRENIGKSEIVKKNQLGRVVSRIDISDHMHLIAERVIESGFTSKQRKKVIYGREKHRNRRKKE